MYFQTPLRTLDRVSLSFPMIAFSSGDNTNTLQLRTFLELSFPQDMQNLLLSFAFDFFGFTFFVPSSLEC